MFFRLLSRSPLKYVYPHICTYSTLLICAIHTSYLFCLESLAPRPNPPSPLVHLVTPELTKLLIISTSLHPTLKDSLLFYLCLSLQVYVLLRRTLCSLSLTVGDAHVTLCEHHRQLRKKSKESFKVGCRLVEIIKSLASSGATRWTKGKGGLGLGASDSRQKRCNACIVQIKSTG